jgi:GAF domain-containing protein
MTTTNLIDTPELNITRLQSLYELIQRMNSVYNLPEMLDFVIDRALNLTGARRGLLLLSNDNTPTLTEVAAVKGENLELADMERILKFVSTTVIKDVLARGETRLVRDLPTDERFGEIASRETLQFKGVRSVLAVPLKAENQLVGLLYLDHPHKTAFSQDDLDFLNAFASQAALAIHRARQHQRQLEELTLLNELSRSVVKVLDLNEVLTRIVTEATRMLNVRACSVLLLDEVTQELAFATSVDRGQRLQLSTRLKKNEGLAGWAMTHGKAIFSNNVPEESRWFGEVEPGFVTQSLLCVPLQMDGRAVGVLEAVNKNSPAGFTNSDIALLSAFAASATIAIENARLFQEARQSHQLRALNEIAMNLSSTLNLNTVLTNGLAQTLRVLKTEAGVIIFTHPQPHTEFVSVQPNPEFADVPPAPSELLADLAAWLLEQNRAGFQDDVAVVVDASRPASPETHRRLAAASLNSIAMAAIKVGGSVAGGLLLVSRAAHAYPPEGLSLLNGVARIIGLAAQNAINYLQLQAQTAHLKTLNDIGSALTRSLEVDRVLEVVMEGVNTLLQTELTSVFLIDEQTNELVLRYTNKGDTHIRLPAPWQGIAGWVATHDQPALVNDTHSDPRHLRQVATDTGYRAQSILCVPLKVEGRMMGVVEVLNKTGGEQFTHYHQSLLIELTKWAAIALHNARLFDERVQAYRRLNTEQQRRIAAETRGAMASIILDMAHTMNNVVGAIRAWALSLEYAIQDTPTAPVSQFARAVAKIRDNTEEALKLMSTMTGPLEQVEVEPVDLHACLQAAVKSCWWPENVSLHADFGDNLPPVSANKERLEAAFHNLLSNAIQAMALPGGQIQLTTRYPVEGMVAVTVADTGPGIPPELQESIFNPGVSSKVGSLGIGLWLVETFIHQFNGRINFTSTDTGATFTVNLPPVAEADKL